MRLRNITGSRELIAENRFVIHAPEKIKGNWRSEVFQNQNPLQIEIGMGKGQFIMKLAEKNPQINYIGIEKYSSVLLRAIQKMEDKQEELKNLRFIRMDANTITDIFESREVDKIYLNFSDPWPKDRHAKRRLPSKEFLACYRKILKDGAKLEFKTDNRQLFDFAMNEAPAAGWQIEQYTYDLHHEPEMAKDNIMTEYEEKFSSAGNPICKYVISYRNASFLF
ncbi:MAG TPA: tRNA (guanosine(46)-N7)-methyltransferase TrmB [Lachnospiraceae bacterium]|nr:tRNA (guanosine(46)-N7)-methyltransferase TrmB [Lachnospiraceae bacterium]